MKSMKAAVGERTVQHSFIIYIFSFFITFIDLASNLPSSCANLEASFLFRVACDLLHSFVLF